MMKPNKIKHIKIDPADNVAVAISPICAGEVIDGISALDDIPAGHKISLCAIPQGAPAVKYGAVIGYAKAEIKAGAHVHVHNLKTGLSGEIAYTYQPQSAFLPPKVAELPDSFKGYLRENGEAGVRNELFIIPTVGCVNGIVHELKRMADTLPESQRIDGITAFPHPYGCSQLGEDQENTRIILADLARHPNAGGVLIVGLGCENSGVESLIPHLGEYSPERVKFMVCQEHDDELEAGLGLIKELLCGMAGMEREEIPASKLVVGLKCGGSDGFSGITANPAVGGLSDLVIGFGGTAILTEVPEMFGAEQLLMNRAKNHDIYEKTVNLINDFKAYYQKADMPIYENPSPGNKEGGITTLEDKSLGCTQKSGRAIVCDVLRYGERVKTPGLNLLSAPGNDLVAATALAASGAQIVLFTTGRGTPFSCPVPTVKISSNTPLWQKKQNWIDFDAGTILDGETMEDAAARLYRYVIDVASGERVRSEVGGYHDMAIFKNGVTL